jgi:hypothetical protein
MPFKDRDHAAKKNREYCRKYYAENRAKATERNRLARQERVARFNELKAALACQKCGENHPAVLDFHHRDAAQKEGEIAVLVRSGSMKRLEAELAKCDVLCANCHRKLHWEERQSMVVVV